MWPLFNILSCIHTHTQANVHMLEKCVEEKRKKKTQSIMFISIMVI